MKILITGGAGFLGYHLARFLDKQNASITLLDINDIDKKEYPGVTHITRGDIRDSYLMKEITRGIDVVIHAAAALPLAPPQEIHDVNVNGTRRVLRAALQNKVKRVIYISSTAVYGVPKIHPIDESAPLVGVGPYGESKIMAEKVCRKYRQKGLNVTIIRPKTFIGTGRLGVFEILFDWVHDNKKIPMIGSGTNRYQLLEVEDLVQAIWKFCNAPAHSRYNDAFNIGADSFGMIRDDLEAFFAAVGSASHIMPIPAWLIKKPLQALEVLHLSPLYQWVYDTADKDSFVSIDKIQRTIDWKPRYSNAQALVRSYQWYQKHYSDIKAKGAGITHTVGWKQGALAIAKRFL